MGKRGLFLIVVVVGAGVLAALWFSGGVGSRGGVSEGGPSVETAAETELSEREADLVTNHSLGITLYQS